MKLTRVFNAGKPARKSKELDAYSMNVSPDTIVATASGTAFDKELLENYDTFVVARTSADTDKIVLPNGLPIGTKIRFLTTTTAIEVGVDATDSEVVNGGTANQDVALIANAMLEMQKITATGWAMEQLTSAGARTTPTAS